MAHRDDLEHYETTEAQDLTRLLRALRPPARDVPVPPPVDFAIRAAIWQGSVRRQLSTLLALAHRDLVRVLRQALRENPLLEEGASEAHTPWLTAAVPLAATADLAAAERYDSLWQACVPDGWEAPGLPVQASEAASASAHPSDPPEALVPDVIVRKVGHDYQVRLNDDGMPRLRLSATSRRLFREGHMSAPEAMQDLDDHLRAAVWLIRSLEYRRQTLLQVATRLVQLQRDGLEQGLAHLQPLALPEVADALGLHASVVSCVLTNKYLATEHGMIALTEFFQHSLTSAGGESQASLTLAETQQLLIKEMVQGARLVDWKPLPADSTGSGASRLPPDEEQRVHQALSPSSLEASGGEPRPSLTVTGRQTRLLIVEDELLMAMDLQRRLTRLGYTVVALAASGAEAIQKTLALHPDVVLMDIRLQGAMDGVEAAQQILASASTPIVFMTAYVDEETTQRVRATSPWGYLHKPFTDQQVQSTLAQVLLASAGAEAQASLTLTETQQLLTKAMVQGVQEVQHHRDQEALAWLHRQGIEWWRLAADPEVRAAHRDLQTALAHPQLRPAVLLALRAFAQAAQAGTTPSPPADTTALPFVELGPNPRARPDVEALSPVHNLNDLLHQAIQRAVALLEVEGASVILLDEERQELYLKVADDPRAGHETRQREVRFPATQGIAGWVLRTGQSLLVPDADRDPRVYHGVDMRTGAKTRSLVCVPLRTQERIIGVLQAINKRQGVFTADDVRRLEAFADQLAPALEQARVIQARDTRDVPPRITAGERLATSTVPFDPLLGERPAMQAVARRVARVLPTTATVLLTGERGTGQDQLARLLHERGPRAQGPFIAVNCRAFPETRLEAELFGDERGAFPGATPRQPGRVELAAGGTLFLEEIDAMSPVLQAKLLRVLQTRQFERIGGTETLTTDARIIAATSHDLERLVGEGKFRRDLYYRLNVYPIVLPPTVTAQDLPQAVANLEKRRIQEALEQAHQNLSLAAKLLGLSRTQLRARLKRYGLEAD